MRLSTVAKLHPSTMEIEPLTATVEFSKLLITAEIVIGPET